jgi:hypothetical protein
LSTHGLISLESEYFRIYATTSIGTGDAAEESEYIAHWKSRCNPIMEKVRELVEREFKTDKIPMNFALIRYNDKLRTTSAVSEEEINPTHALDFLRERKGPCAFTMRLHNVEQVDDLYIDICFASLPDWRDRERLKKKFASAIKPVTKPPLSQATKFEYPEGTVHKLFIANEIRAASKQVPSIELSLDGITGDFSPWRAMGHNYDFLILPRDTLGELNKAGWHVQPGDLQENISVQGISFQHFTLGRRLRVGSAEIILTGRRNMDNLLTYEHGAADNLQRLPFVERRWTEFQDAVRDRLGLFAQASRAGVVRKGDSIRFL